MTIAEILADLSPYTGKFPKAAIQAAMSQRDEITPHLLAVLEECAKDPPMYAHAEKMLHLFATYLLGYFREQRAYRPLVKTCMAPEQTLEKLFGDTITEALPRIFASVYDGDPKPPQSLIENESAYEFARGAAVDSLLVLAYTEQASNVSEYFAALFHGKLRREYSNVWNSLCSAVADLPAPELIADVRVAFEDGLADPSFASLESLKLGARVPAERKPEWQVKKYALIGDPISEMTWCAAFHAEETPPKPFKASPEFSHELKRSMSDAGEHRAGRVVPIRDGPKVGRNDPCPCGSGKKFKKCCLGKTPASPVA